MKSNKSLFEFIIKQDNEPIIKAVFDDVDKIDKEVLNFKKKFE